MRDSRCIHAMENLPVLCDSNNRRLLAACAYFQKAVRLASVGVGPSEFASEAVINVAKVLEVLFPGNKSRDAARTGLLQIGYKADEIEQKFIPALLLRSYLDAAHVRMATLSAGERRKLQIYMENAAGDFREMITKVVEAVRDNKLQLAKYRDERKEGDEISRILKGIGGRGI